MLQKSYLDVTHHGDVQRCYKKYHKMLKGKIGSYEMEKRYLHKDGSVVWGVLNITCMRDSKGEPRYSVAQVLDITDRKSAENRLRFSAELLDTVEHSVMALDLERRINYWNRSAEKLYGWKAEEVMGLDVRDLVAPRITAEGSAEIIETLEMGQSWTGELEVRRRGGAYFHAMVTNTPIYDEEDNLTGIIAVSSDITERKRVEQELKNSEARFAAIHKYSPFAVVLTDRDRQTILANPAFSMMIGYTVEELEAVDYTKFSHPDDLKKELELYKKLADGKRDSFQLEKRIVSANGELIWVNSHTVAVRDHKGELSYLVTMAEDITERKRAVEALRLSEHSLSDAQRLAKIGSWVWEIDSDRVVCSEEMLRLWWYSPDRGPLSFSRDILSRLHPEDIESVDALVKKSLRDGTPCDAQFKIVSPRGEERFIHGSAYPELDHKGNPVVMRGTGQDITERAKLESEKLATQILLDEVGKIAKIGGWEMDLITREAKWTNGTYEIVEIEPGQPVPGPDDHVEYYLPQYRPMVAKAMADLVKQDKPINFEAEMRTAKGNIKWCRAMGRAERKDGKAVRIFGTFQDITELKRAEEEKALMESRLAQAQKMDALGTLSSGIAHDFNNILGVILGYSELVMADLPKDSTLVADVSEITQAAAKARGLVKQIMAFSRRSDSNPKPVHIGQAVSGAAAMLKRTIPKMINLEIDLAPETRPVIADSQQLAQIILNLVSNAVDAIEGSGTIWISARDVEIENEYCEVSNQPFNGSYVMLSVKDTGRGMDSEVREKIYDPFFTTKPIGMGTGLGLSTVYGIVRAVNGHMVCRTRDNQGTEFCIFFQPAQNEDIDADGSASHDDQNLSGHETILVVDDVEALRKMASRVLTNNGYRVMQAASAEEALEKYQAGFVKIDAVLMDLGMPGMGGKACIPKLLELDPGAKVIIATGYIQYELNDELQSLGAAGLVPKPYDKSALLAKLREVLDRPVPGQADQSAPIQ